MSRGGRGWGVIPTLGRLTLMGSCEQLPILFCIFIYGLVGVKVLVLY